uniref:SH3 domain-containing protein n=1 Tax=Amphimedon queenslandica TaxID=400682 RepID=A0A1X7TW36_AMPQE
RPFFFNAAHKTIFNEIRGSFGILRVQIVPLISQSIPSVAELKLFLQLSFPELSPDLSNADSIEDIMNFVVKKCRVNDISIIKTIVKQFKIAEAKPLISEYEKEVKTVSGSLKDFLSQNQPEHFLICETIQFTLGWEPEEHSLDDIRNLLEEAFKELNKRIIVRSIHRGNSIIIICYGPHHLLAALLLEAQDNLTVLLKEFSLIRLTIGHYTVYDKRIRYKVMNNECLAEEIKLVDGEEQELRTLLDYKEGVIVDLLLNYSVTYTNEKDQWTQSPTAESIYTARINYHGIWGGDLSFREEKQLEIYDKWSSFWWKGRSLVSGDEGDIPSSCVYSMLESLQLLEFILSVEEVSLPILQKIRNDSSSNDEKASLFLETINDDPIMISALRQDKEQHDKGVTGSINRGSDSVSLTSPSPVQCNEVISNINNNHKEIDLRYSSTNSTVSLLSSTKLHTLNLRRLEIRSTPLTNDCIQYLCILLTNNKTIQELVISIHSISDRGVTNICRALEHNSTLTSLYLYDNPLISSASGRALSYLVLNNSSLVELNLRHTSLSTKSILLILQSLMDYEHAVQGYQWLGTAANYKYKTRIRRLILDHRHKETCINHHLINYYLIQDSVYWR